MPDSPDTSIVASHSRSQPFPVATLKRRASPSFEGLEDDSSRKRKREDQDDALGSVAGPRPTVTVENPRLADELAEELQCGCCSELVYRPVVVSPCQHFFCGR